MAGFYPYRSTVGLSGGEEYDFIIEGVATAITLGDAVDVAAGYAGRCAAGDRIMGVVVGFGKQLSNGEVVPLDHPGAGSVTGTRAGNAGVIGSDTYTPATDNTTVDKVTARVLVDPNMQYYNDADDTLTQAMIGRYFDHNSDPDDVDVATEAAYSAQWILMEIDPHNDADVSKGIFKLVESQLTA